MTSTMPLLSLESAAMLCRVDSRGRLGLLLRRRVGPLLFRAGGREQCLLPLFPGRLKSKHSDKELFDDAILTPTRLHMKLLGRATARTGITGTKKRLRGCIVLRRALRLILSKFSMSYGPPRKRLRIECGSSRFVLNVPSVSTVGDAYAAAEGHLDSIPLSN